MLIFLVLSLGQPRSLRPTGGSGLAKLGGHEKGASVLEQLAVKLGHARLGEPQLRGCLALREVLAVEEGVDAPHPPREARDEALEAADRVRRAVILDALLDRLEVDVVGAKPLLPDDA